MKRPAAIGGIAFGAMGLLVSLVIFFTFSSTSDTVADQTGSVHETFSKLEKQYEGTSEPLGVLAQLGIDGAVRGYLETKLGVSSFGDPVFCSVEFLGLDEDGSDVTIYVWTYCDELYVAGSELARGGGKSEPVIVYARQNGEGYDVYGHEEPKIGSAYMESVQSIFPERLHAKILPDLLGEDAMHRRVQLLSYYTEKRGRSHYGLK